MQSTTETVTASQKRGHKTQSLVDEKSATRKSIHPEKISITFDMNRLQRIPMPGEAGSPGRVLVSMNPIHPPSKIKGTYYYRHPLFSSASVSASERLHLINGVGNVSFAGAWMGHGFHEDGFAAGLQAARNIMNPTQRCSRGLLYGTETEEQARRLHLRDQVCRVALQLVQLLIDCVPLESSRRQPATNLGWFWVCILMMAVIATVQRLRSEVALSW